MDNAYWIGLLIYGFGALLLMLLIYLPLRQMSSALWRWSVLWTLFILLFFPWFSSELNNHIAPNMMVAAFALLDSGLFPALELLQMHFGVWLLGLLLVMLCVWIFGRKKSSAEE